jgi:hypothetical protein
VLVETELPASSAVMLEEASGNLTVTAANPYPGYAYLPNTSTTRSHTQCSPRASSFTLKHTVTKRICHAIDPDLHAKLHGIVVCHRNSR